MQISLEGLCGNASLLNNIIYNGVLVVYSFSDRRNGSFIDDETELLMRIGHGKR